MRYEPHEYQKYAVDYIETHPAAAIFLDCGLGKTSITLTAIADLLFDSFEVHKVLVIAPLRVARDTWTSEADKWDHLQDLICSVAVGTEAQRRSALMRRADIYIINRENVQWLIDAFVNGALCDDVLYHHSFRSLPLPPESRYGLLIKLQAPGQSEPHDGRTAALEIQPMPGGSGMDQRHRQLAIVPSADTGGVIQL